MMKQADRLAFVVGLVIGTVAWLFLIGYTVFELFNRIVNNTGDPFPVLTLIAGLAILVRQTSLSAKFQSIQEWINK